MKYIFVYSNYNVLKAYGKVDSEKGKVFLDLLNIENLELKEVIIKNTLFQEIRNKVKLSLKELIDKNKEIPMEYPTNIENQNFDSFIEKEVLGKKIRLFQGGIEGTIISLSNLFDLLELAINENHDYFKVLLMSHIEHIEWLKTSRDGASMS